MNLGVGAHGLSIFYLIPGSSSKTQWFFSECLIENIAKISSNGKLIIIWPYGELCQGCGTIHILKCTAITFYVSLTMLTKHITYFLMQLSQSGSYHRPTGKTKKIKLRNLTEITLLVNDKIKIKTKSDFRA